MFGISRKSIIIKLSIIMLAIVFLQSVFLIGSVIFSGVISSLEDNAYGAFSEKIGNRKNYFENDMNARWSNIEGYASEICRIYDDRWGRSMIGHEEETTAFLEEVTPYLISMLRSTMTTGGFIILDDNITADAAHSGVYLKDYDPTFGGGDNTDLYMVNGPVAVSRAMQIPLEKSWGYGITLDEETRKIFDKPYQVATQSDDPKLLGYWSVSPNATGNGISMLTYTMPLIDKQGQAFGVIGIEVAQDYLYKMLPNTEISQNSALGYVLAIYDKKTDTLVPVLTQGALQKEIAPVGEPLQLSMANQKEGVYKIEESNANFVVLCHPELLKVYNNNTPFSEEQWVLLGMVDEESILGFSQSFVSTLSMSFLISLIVGIVVISLVSINFAKPIIALSKDLKCNDPKTVVTLGRTGLAEIDELSVAIEMLNKNILEAVLKTEKIIDMVNLPLGTFEYRKGTNFVTISPIIFALLKIEQTEPENRVEKDCFFQRITEIERHVEDEANHIYLLDQEESAWVKIVYIENETDILGVVMDMTKDVLEKHTMLFERDYDPLTKIYNRYAFKREVEKIFAVGLTGETAFIMFDLDNLKYINDTYGHDYGDRYIHAAAEVIAGALNEKSVVGRMSGDEFYVFLYDFASKDEIRNTLKRLYEALDINRLLLPNGNEFKIRMSGGVAWYGEHSNNLDELIRYADFAMYQGKHTIKGEIREFDQLTYESESFMLSGREELNKVLDNQLIEFAFQPIICAKTGTIYGYESLMRPQSEVLNSPQKLIQIATSQSRLWQVEKITFYKTLSTYVRYENLFKGCKIFINSVPSEILKETEYREIENLYGHILKNVVVEIIESEKLDSSTLAFKKDLMVRWDGALALDDYGSGYNGDISLLSISPQIVKIDQVLIKGVERDKNRQSIIQKLLVYAKEQDILVLAEGVETKAQMAHLVGMGVDLLQGYYVARPNFIPDYDNTTIIREISEIIERLG